MRDVRMLAQSQYAPFRDTNASVGRFRLLKFLNGAFLSAGLELTLTGASAGVLDKFGESSQGKEG